MGRPPGVPTLLSKKGLQRAGPPGESVPACPHMGTNHPDIYLVFRTIDGHRVEYRFVLDSTTGDRWRLVSRELVSQAVRPRRNPCGRPVTTPDRHFSLFENRIP
jgi:hypothetical protein